MESNPNQPPTPNDGSKEYAPQQPPFEQPKEEREINYDPRERPRPEFVAPQTPPPGYRPPGYAPPQEYPPPSQGYVPPGYYAGPASTGPTAPRRRGAWFGCLITAIIILLLCAGLSVLGTLLGFGFALRNSVTEPPRTFPITEHPSLILTSDAGSITINKGDIKNIAIQATKSAGFGGNVNDVQINYSQSGSTVNVTFQRSGAFNFFNAASVDFTITVPPTTDLQLTTNAGSISVSGISGKMSLISNAGTIGATQASLLEGSKFRTNAGSINFTGSIGTSGTYELGTNAGSIDVTLPGTAAFHVKATTNAGSINTSFPVTVNHSGPGATVNDDVGSAPQATVMLTTNAGSIRLNRGS